MDQPPPPLRTRLKWWGLIFVLILVVAVTCVTTLVYFLDAPAFESVAVLDVGQVKSMTAFAVNRPDGGPDVGHPSRPVTIAPEDYEKLLAPLRKGERVKADRGVWLGQLTVRLADGRRQSIRLYRAAAADPKAPPVLRFTIGRNQFEAGPSADWLAVLTACEERAKTGPPG